MLFQVNGKKIERARLALALSQDELAAKAGISDRTVRRLESGEQTTARMVSIESIAGVLGEPAQAFLQGAAGKNQNLFFCSQPLIDLIDDGFCLFSGV